MFLLKIILSTKRISQSFAENFEVIGLSCRSAVLLHRVVGLVTFSGKADEETGLTEVEIEAFGTMIPKIII